MGRKDAGGYQECSCVVPLEGAEEQTHRDYFLCFPLMLFQQEPLMQAPFLCFTDDVTEGQI